jgi:hypothetical protein
MTVVHQIRRYIAEAFYPPPELTDEGSLWASGTLDATGMLALCHFVDRRFGVFVPECDAVLEHFDSIVKVAAYVERRLGERDAPRLAVAA